MADGETMLGMTEAATRLHLTASLLRKWTDHGLITTMKRPGRGYQRFTVTDIERKRRELRLDEQEI